MIDQMGIKQKVQLLRWSTTKVEDIVFCFVNLGLSEKIYKSKKIGIKVNLAGGTIFKNISPVITNPDVLEMVLISLLRIQPELTIYIMESDSVMRGFAEKKFQNQGYAQRFSHLKQVQLLDLSHTQVNIFDCAKTYFKDGIVLSRIFAEIDFFISLSKLKTHTNTVMTGSLKNLFGCLPDGDKDKYHPYLPMVITDLASAIMPDLSILDACPAMEGNGPIFGEAKNLDLLILGDNPVAVDATGARIMGFEPAKIPTLRKCMDVKLGSWVETDITLSRRSLEEFRTKFNFIKLEQQLFVQAGFLIQILGDHLHKLGYYVHLIQGVGWAFFRILRKLLRFLFKLLGGKQSEKRPK